MITATAAAVEPEHAPTHAVPLAWRRVFAVVAPSAVLTLLLPTVLIWLGDPIPPSTVAATVSTMHSAIAVAASVVVVRAALRMEGRARRAWTLIGAGAGLWGASNVAWMIDVTTGSNPTGSPDWIPAFTAANAVLLVGAVLLPASPTRVAKIRRLDTAIMMVAATGVLWVLPITSLMNQVRGLGDATLYTALGAIKVLTVLVAMGAFVRCRPDTHNEIRPLACSLVILGVADLVFASSDSVGYPMGSRVADALYTAAVMLLFVTGIRLSGPSVPVVERNDRRVSVNRLALPELATVAALVALAVNGQFRRGNAVVGLAMASVLVLLAIVRLGQLEHEQRRLVASLSASAQRLHEQARLDSLTGLGNRLALDERLAKAARRLPADGPHGLAVFFIDVDHFKRFNDALGHHVGDRLLVEISGRLRDVLGEDVHRVGGDEFVAVRTRVDLRGAELLAQDVITVVRAPVVIDGHELSCAVSVGLSHLGPDSEDAPSDHPGDVEGDTATAADTLLRQADLALYRAKEQGRNQWTLYDPSLQHRADDRLRMQQGLHRALERDELEVHYQPVVALASGDIVGVTASPRWRSPDHGLLGPAAFMPTVIDGGLLPQLSEVLFADIARTLRSIRSGDAPMRWVSTALSREEIVHPGLLRRIEHALDDAGAAPGQLRIEVTEGTVVDRASLIVIDGLRELGVDLAVHTFGTGPSSLLSLGQYPASALSVDSSFVEGIGRRRDDTAIVTAVAGMTADLGLELAADGISEAFQAQMLLDLGCALGKGRLFGEAVPTWQAATGTAAAAPR